MNIIYIRSSNELANILENYKDTPITIAIQDKEYTISSVSCETTYTDPVETSLTLNVENEILGNIVK